VAAEARRGSSDRRGALGFDRETGIGSAFGDPSLDNRNPPRHVVPYFGNCTSPVRMASVLGRDVELGVRCRRCPGCLRARSFLWRLRAEAEVFGASQSFLFTGTYRAQYLDLEPVSESVTKWLKRLRYYVDSKSALRYLVAFERHKSGAWHMHALLHDVNGQAGDLLHRSSLAWRDGFSNCKPVDLRGAGYVTKYVSKDLDQAGESARRPRIRASRSPTYGAVVLERSEDIVRALQERRVRLEYVYKANFMDILNWVNRRESVWKQAANLAQTNGVLLLNSERRVDRETGEILPYRKG